MPQLLDAHVAADPRRAAVIDERGELSRGELAQRADRLLHALRELGLGVGDTVALLSGNRREAFEALLATQHGGMILVPVNRHFAAAEVAYVVADSGAAVLLVEAGFAIEAAAAQRSTGVTVVVLDAPSDGQVEGVGDPVDYEQLLAASPDGPPDGQCAGTQMVYTSGTTGRPKGVRRLNPPGGPLDPLRDAASGLTTGLGLPAGGVTLLCGPLYHSAQLAFSYWPLLVGSTVVMHGRFDVGRVLDDIPRHGVTNTHLVPTQMVRLLDVPDERRRRFDPSSLVTVLHGAAPCPPHVKRAMIDWWGPVLSEYYGATESGVATIITALEWLQRPGSVGRAMPQVEVVAVDDDGHVVGPGEEGLMYVRPRPEMIFEYHNAPDKTAAATLEPGVTTTGDVGWHDEDGYWYLSDRRIDMIVSGGVNIYPAEIESVLMTHEAVADCAVFGVPDDEYGEQVKAAVELSPGHEAGEELQEALIAHCRAHLAGYKRPRSVDFHDTLGRTATGKLQKHRLRAPYWEAAGRRI